MTLISELVAANGLLQIADFDDRLDDPELVDAADLGLVTVSLSPGWTAHTEIRLTRKGRAAYGLPPAPSFFDAIRGLLMRLA